MNRRDILKSTVAAAVSARIAVSRGMIWHGGAASGTAPQTFDFYISPAGSDSNTGSLASPWALTAINTKWAAYAGRRLGIIGDQGTYDCLTIVGGSYTTNSLDYEVAAFEIQGGTSGSPTYVGSSDSSGHYAARLATLNANANVTNNQYGKGLLGHNGISGQSMGYVTIDGLVLTNGFLQLLNIGRGQAIGAQNVHGIIIQNCAVENVSDSLGGTNPACMLLQNMNGPLIQNNYCYGASSAGITGQAARASGMQIYWTTGAIIQYNTCVAADGYMSAGISFKDPIQSNNTIRYNFCYQPNQVQGSGAIWCGVGTDEDGGTFNVYNNISVGPGVAIPYIGGSPSPDPANYSQNWYNNTFVGTTGVSWSDGWWRSGLVQSISSYNNIFQRSSNSQGTRGDISISANAGNIIDYNLYPASSFKATMTTSGSGGTYPSIASSYTTLSTWQAGLASNSPSCIGKDAHSVLSQDSTYFGSGTAIFVGGIASNAASYKLIAGAPGSAIGSNPGSSNGQTSGSAIDMGAWGGTDVNTGLPIAQIGCNFV